jgi:hypothetical protein
VGKLACGTPSNRKCPFRTTCPYFKQFHLLGPRIGTAEQLFNPRFLDGGDALVVDDADLSRTLVERHRLTLEVLARSVEQLKGKHWLPVRRLLSLVHHAVVDAPQQEDGQAAQPLLGAAVWDHLARTARRYGEYLSTMVDTLPRSRLLPKPSAKDGAALSPEDVWAVPPASVLQLLRALREELPSFLAGEEFNCRMRLDAGGIDIWQLRELPDDTREGKSFGDLPLLVLDATPVEAFVSHLTQRHQRLPDVRAVVRLPENVRVVQYAASSNGHAVLREDGARQRVASEIAAERESHPAAQPEQEAAVCFRSQRQIVENLGFDPSQVLTFGNARGSNALAQVERLHVIGRPMPPGEALIFLAQVLHHHQEPVSGQLVLGSRPYGGQRYQTDVVDFADPRVAALLQARREDELVQVVHRARLVALDPQARLDAADNSGSRSQVRLVLHTNHPVPGLRVDELKVGPQRADVNQARKVDAEARIVGAAETLRQRGEPVTVTAVAEAAGAHKATVAKVWGQRCIPLENNLDKGMHYLPQISEDDCNGATFGGHPEVSSVVSDPGQSGGSPPWRHSPEGPAGGVCRLPYARDGPR